MARRETGVSLPPSLVPVCVLVVGNTEEVHGKILQPKNQPAFLVLRGARAHAEGGGRSYNCTRIDA